jgi:hypothetical protein
VRSSHSQSKEAEVRVGKRDGLPRICIGSSHMACVLHAAEEAGTPLEAIVLKDRTPESFRELERTNLTLDPTRFDPTKRELSSETESRLRAASGVCCFLNGNHHLALGLWRHPEPFDLVLPEAPDLPLEHDAQVVPADAMRALLTTRLQRQLRTVSEIANLAAGPVYQFEAAPPPRDTWMLKLAPGQKTRAKKRKVPAGSDGKLAGRFVRYKLWRLHSQIMREYTEQAGIRFVAHPPEAVDDEGFLRDELCRNATHANAAYGALILEQMRSLP